mgnify:CR=1 FL=1
MRPSSSSGKRSSRRARARSTSHGLGPDHASPDRRAPPARPLGVRRGAAAVRPARQERRVLRRTRLDALGRGAVRLRAAVRSAGDPDGDRGARPRSRRGRSFTWSSSGRSSGSSSSRGFAARAGPAGCSSRWPPRSGQRPRLAYLRLAGVRLVLTVLAPAPLLFLALFLLSSDASRLTFTGTDNALAAGERAQVPVRSGRLRRAPGQLAARRARQDRRRSLPQLRRPRRGLDLVREHEHGGRRDDARGSGDPHRAGSRVRMSFPSTRTTARTSSPSSAARPTCT